MGCRIKRACVILKEVPHHSVIYDQVVRRDGKAVAILTGSTILLKAETQNEPGEDCKTAFLFDGAVATLRTRLGVSVGAKGCNQ